MTSPRPRSLPPGDEDRLLAAVDLCGRAGARAFEVGFLHDDVPLAEAAWYAHAQYRGARLTAENCPSPGEAAEQLARRLLTGARCKCGKLVALSPDGALAFERVVMADGTTWTAGEAARAGLCRWTRRGRYWDRECEPVA